MLTLVRMELFQLGIPAAVFRRKVCSLCSLANANSYGAIPAGVWRTGRRPEGSASARRNRRYAVRSAEILHSFTKVGEELPRNSVFAISW